jgi:hypothetical protein
MIVETDFDPKAALIDIILSSFVLFSPSFSGISLLSPPSILVHLFEGISEFTVFPKFFFSF